MGQCDGHLFDEKKSLQALAINISPAIKLKCSLFNNYGMNCKCVINLDAFLHLLWRLVSHKTCVRLVQIEEMVLLFRSITKGLLNCVDSNWIDKDCNGITPSIMFCHIKKNEYHRALISNNNWFASNNMAGIWFHLDCFCADWNFRQSSSISRAFTAKCAFRCGFFYRWILDVGGT